MRPGSLVPQDWPECPSLRFLFHWALRRDSLTTDERERLEELMQSPAGVLLSQVLDLDFALEKHIQFRLDEIDCETFRALQIVSEERNKFMDAQGKQPSGDHR